MPPGLVHTIPYRIGFRALAQARVDEYMKLLEQLDVLNECRLLLKCCHKLLSPFNHPLIAGCRQVSPIFGNRLIVLRLYESVNAGLQS